MRPTSAKSFHEIEESGLLNRLQLIVYRVIDDNGPITTGEISTFLPARRLNSISPRLAELARMKAIHTTGERRCNLTGKTALVWEVLGQPEPHATVKPKSKVQLLRKELAEANKEIERLETIVINQQKKLKQWGRPTKETIANRPPDATLMLPLQ